MKGVTANSYRTILDVLETDGQLIDPPKGTVPAIKFVQPDWTTYDGYRWPFPGQWTPDIDDWNPVACKSGGVHVATTVAGAQSGGARGTHCLLVAYRPDDAGYWDLDDESTGKLKVRRAFTVGPVDLLRALRQHGNGAYLTWADLYGADLYRADLYGADLTEANLTRANLTWATLTRADLTRATLNEADLTRADLNRATLTGADLTRADLNRATLYGADLTRADLNWANLTGAKWNKHTIWPTGYTP